MSLLENEGWRPVMFVVVIVMVIFLIYFVNSISYLLTQDMLYLIYLLIFMMLITSLLILY